MKSLLLALGLTTLSMGVSAQTQPTIYGSVVFGHLWEDMGDKAPYGVYSLPANDASKMSSVCLDSKIKALGGGVYVDGHYYLVDYSPYENERTVAYRIYDVDKGWKLVSEQKIPSYSSVASDLAYDPSTDKIYGCFRADAATLEYFFGTFNPVTGFSSKIAPLKEELMALACTKDGKLYGIGAYGMLYSVDKETGALTEIGQTGKTVKYAQSATFDYASGRMFWAMTPHYTDEQPEICEVNLNNGSVTTLTSIPDRYEFTGIFTKSSYADSNAPSAPQKLVADFRNGSLTGNISFSVPRYTEGGTALSGKVTYILKIDEDTKKENTASAGSAVTMQQTLTRGMHYIKVTAKNDSGRSSFARYDLWAGIDVVNAADPVAKKNDDGTVSVSWTAPTEGNHGGYFDKSDVSYTVTRQPDNKVVYDGKDVSFVDESAKTLQYGNYYYTVKAKTGDEYGDEARTEYIQIGSTLKLPYSQDFNDEASASAMTVDNVNGDDITWTYYPGSMSCGVNDGGEDNDDWLITPAFVLSTDSIYQVTVDATTDGEGYTELMQVAAGTVAAGSGMTQMLIPTTKVTNTEDKDYSAMFTPEKSGVCYIGIHDMSKSADGSYLNVIKIGLKTIGSTKSAEAPANAKAEAVGAERKVNVSFDAPSKDLRGNAITANLKSIEVKRTADSKVVKTFSNVAPGANCSFTDTPDCDGMVEYSIRADNGYGFGDEARVSAFVGYDIPEAVTGAKAAADVEGNVAVSWNAPQKGVHGGVIDQSSMKYTVENLDGRSSKSTVVNTPSYTEKMTLKDGEQRLAWYLITPETTQGRGETVSTDTVFVGKPYSLPYVESFPRKQLQKGPWCPYNSEVAMWDLMQYGTYADPSDFDGGLLAFSSVIEGSQARFVGPKVSLKDSKNPQLSLYVYNMKNSTHNLAIELVTPDGELHLVDSFVPNDCDLDNNAGDWKEYKYDVSSYKDYDYVQLSLLGTAHEPAILSTILPMYVDQISITDPDENNLVLDEMTAENGHVCVGDEANFNVVVTNNGLHDASGYTVNLYRDGNMVASATGKDIKPGYGVIVKVTDVPNSDAKETSTYRAELVWDKDMVDSDNVSKNVVITVLPGKPYVSSVKAVAAGSNAVNLSWSEPKDIAKGTTAETVTEDFESYSPFTISNFGEWTLVDADKQNTFGIQDGTGNFVQYDNVEAPMAYQIFNPTAAKLSSYYFPTHSGNQVAAAFSSGRSVANDDWLISPEVDGEQTVKFWASSPDSKYYMTQEQIEVLYSKTGTQTADFTKIGNTITVPEQWTEYSVALPAGTKYFAIRCVSKDQYILFLDDITYRKAARDFRLLGYNVYRNDVLLNSAPVSATSYVADFAADKNDVYKVSAVYNTGESHLTAAEWDGGTGIAEIGSGAENMPKVVYDIAGRRIPADKIVNGGVYIIKQGKQTRKVVAK